jgi:hypothetical protein
VLVSANGVEVPFFVHRNSETDESRKVEIWSLSDFFHKLADPKLEPVTVTRLRR